MRPELQRIRAELQRASGVAAAVLPMPYARGHFLLHGAHGGLGEDYETTVRGDSTFVTLSRARLGRALEEMDANAPRCAVDPTRSPRHTLAHQILTHGFARGEMDCPHLARLCLDLDEDCARRERVLAAMEREMGARYAECLRRGATASMLPAAARQMVLYADKEKSQPIDKTEE